jgi:O-antigen/teichoic acid export membrane protein
MAARSPVREELAGVSVPEATWRARWFGPGTFVRSASTLVSGTVVSQAIVFALSPFLSRLFSPADFGHLANYNAWVSVLALVSNMRYEHAIIVARGRLAMNRVLALTLTLSALATVVFTLLAIAITVVDPQRGYLAEIKAFVAFIPPAVAATVVTSALTQFAIRRGHFRRIAWISVAQIGVTILFQISFGVAHIPSGLIVGALLGAFLGTVSFVVMHLAANRIRHVGREIRLDRLRSTALTFANFPRFTLPADAISIVIQQFVPVFLTALFNPVVAGLYAFSTRVVRVPSFVISTSVSTVLRKRAADHLAREGNLARLFRKTVSGLAVLAIGPFLIMMLYAPPIFEIVFGSEWREAGRIVRILGPGMFAEFVAFPLTVFFLITQTQWLAFRLQLLNLALLTATFLIGRHIFESFLATCMLLSGALVIVNLATILLARRVSRRRAVSHVA